MTFILDKSNTMRQVNDSQKNKADEKIKKKDKKDGVKNEK